MNLGPSPSILVRAECERDLVKTITLEESDRGFCYQGPSFPPLLKWLESYAKKEGALLPPLFLHHLPPFTHKVLKKLLSIPWGKTLSYSEVAESLNNPKACRAVGSACGRNPFPLLIPCHRVIGRNNALGGYTPHLGIKKELIKFELK